MTISRRFAKAYISCFCAGSALTATVAHAGSGANFVTYNHHMAKYGEKEVTLYSDFSHAGVQQGYSAQLLELEYGVTDRWTSSLYFEGDALDGEPYEFGGWRFENRVRVFADEVPLNPVLYLEYENLEPSHRYKRAVTGRSDGDEEQEEDEETEHEIETKLILGQDISKRLDVAFNWINEVNVDTGKWEFGYATGLNYLLVEEAGLIEEMKFGLELFGGLGDSEEGLTIDGSKTEQYLGINLLAEIEKGPEIGVGIALGLTGSSEDAIFRMKIAYEFK